MSWRATAYVKELVYRTDGGRFTAREKLALFVLADSYNDDRNCAWISVPRAAAQALTSERHFIRLLDELEKSEVVTIARRQGLSSLYSFPGLTPKPEAPPCGKPVEKSPRKAVKDSTRPDMVSGGGVTQLCQGGGDIAMSPEPPITSKSQNPSAERVLSSTSERAAKPAAQVPKPPVNESQKRYAVIRRLADRAEFLLRKAPELSDADAGEILKGWAASIGLEYFWPGSGNSPIVQALIIARAKINPSREPCQNARA